VYQVGRINETIKEEFEEEFTRTESGIRDSKLEPASLNNKKTSGKLHMLLEENDDDK
jgi:hypothetical protein